MFCWELIDKILTKMLYKEILCEIVLQTDSMNFF